MNAAARKYFPTDSATVQNNLREAAALTEVELSSRTVYQLRDLLRICGIKQVVREGKQVPIRQATRTELLKELEIATNPYRLLASATIEPELVEEDIQKLDFESVRDLLKTATEVFYATLAEETTKTNAATARVKAFAVASEKARGFAYEVNNWITRNYADTPHLARFYARCNHRGQYCVRVGELVKKESEAILTQMFGVYESTLKALGKYDSELKAKGNSERLDSYESNKIPVAITKLHDWMLSTLADPTGTDWKNVVVAIAASTGRRIYSEILAGTGRYEVASEHELKFTGVAKGKEVNNESYLIPTIAPAADVVKSIAVLEKLEKRIACDDPTDYASVIECRRVADKRHSKNVGEHWKKNLCFSLLALDPNDEETKKADKDITTLHGLRKLYVMHYTRGLSDLALRRKASELLCHSGDGSVASDNYTSVFSLAD